MISVQFTSVVAIVCKLRHTGGEKRGPRSDAYQASGASQPSAISELLDPSRAIALGLEQGLAECIEELLAVFVGVIGVEADAKQASVGRYSRWADGGNEDPCIEEFLRETESFVGVMDVEGNDRSRIGGGAESSQG